MKWATIAAINLATSPVGCGTIGIYAVYMSARRNKARHDVREGLTRIE
jgi:hypothetical protein